MRIYRIKMLFILSILLASITATVPLTESYEEKVTINTSIVDGKQIRVWRHSIPKVHLKSVEDHLIKLSLFLKERDRNSAIREICFLKRDGILRGNTSNLYNMMLGYGYHGHPLTSILSNQNSTDLSNYICYVNSVGYGLMIFTIGHILYLLSNGTAFAPLEFYILILILTHIVPFRILLPVGLILLKNGSLSTTGLLGHRSVKVKNNSSIKTLTVIGFTGVTINIPLGKNQGFLFVSGGSLIATKRNIFNYTSQ